MHEAGVLFPPSAPYEVWLDEVVASHNGIVATTRV